MEQVTSSPSLQHSNDVACTGPSAYSDAELQFEAFFEAEGSFDDQAKISRSPSNILISTLGPIGRWYKKPRNFTSKSDLSYYAPLSAGTKFRRGPIPLSVNTDFGGFSGGESRENQAIFYKNHVGLILAQYIQDIHPLLISSSQCNLEQKDLNTALLKIFDDGTLRLLETQGWEISDLMSWAWILTAESAERAATRFMMLASPPSGTGGEAIPQFVFMFLLRRRDMNVQALRLLISHAWDRLLCLSTPWIWNQDVTTHHAEIPTLWEPHTKANHHSKKAAWRQMSEPTTITMIVRLLRHSRRLWPAACVNIAVMFTKFIDGRSPETLSQTVGSAHTRLTALYNRMLSLLSLPSSTYPIQSMAYHQRAQFTILRKMHQFKPALAVNREGYRAITLVQLAHKKTIDERNWASLKAQSWPPWKEEKNRLDVVVGPEHGISRAGESIRRSREAGYASLNWERAAEILAGWDTDRSPTIQVRTVVKKPLLSRDLKETRMRIEPEQHVDIWTARIKATRTLNEGWLCFLAFVDQKGTPSAAQYYAMFEKIIYDDKRQRTRDLRATKAPIDSSTPPTLAGDGLEVARSPQDPRVSVYVRIPPPSEEQLFDRMIKDNIHPSGRFLAFLLSYAKSFHAGMTYLKTSSLPRRTIEALTAKFPNQDSSIQAELGSLPDYLFGAFIQFLCRWTTTPSVNNKITQETIRWRSILDNTRSFEVNPASPLENALCLMACRKPHYRPPWYSLLSAIGRPRKIIKSDFLPGVQTVQDILAWNSICDVLEQMRVIELDLDLQGFHIVCTALGKAALASKRFIRSSKKSATSSCPSYATYREFLIENVGQYNRIRFYAEQVLLHGLPRVKMMFKILVASSTAHGALTNIDNEKAAHGVLDDDNFHPGTGLPRLLEVPRPSQLHTFIRVLGLNADYTGILDLIKWMARFAPELRAVAAEAIQGAYKTRQCVIAARVFLERDWTTNGRGAWWTKGEDVDTEESAPMKLVEEVYYLIEGVEEWGGWPSDEEVEEYCCHREFT